jgi:hypothetical protein
MPTPLEDLEPRIIELQRMLEAVQVRCMPRYGLQQTARMRGRRWKRLMTTYRQAPIRLNKRAVRTLEPW